MKKVKNIFLFVLKFTFKSIFYTCFALGAFYLVAVISCFLGYLDFNFSFFKNANPEELKLMLRVMIQKCYILGIIFTMLEYGHKYHSSISCEISYHKSEPLSKAKEVKKG